MAIAGHRTTYLAPFRHIDELGKGDQIVRRDALRRASPTRVERTRIVDRRPTSRVHPARRRYDRLILSACNPLYSAAQRIIVFARLVQREPRGAALTGSPAQTLVEKAPGLSSAGR